MNLLTKLSRFLTGSVFVFSGIVKGVDPLGTAYRIEDYFVAYGTEWANVLALSLSILLCATEFSIGMALLTKTKMRLTTWLLLLIMVFFTLITFYDALYSPVPDCGCFGDALKLTNWQTFFKNIVLMAFALVLFRNRKSFNNRLTRATQFGVMSLFFTLFISFSMYNYRHLPLIDFTVWKKGSLVISEEKFENQVFVAYKNHKTGEMKEFLSPNYPWADSVWMSEWAFVGQRVVSEGDDKDFGLFIEDENGQDYTMDLMLNEKQWLITVSDIQELTYQDVQKLVQFTREASIAGAEVVLLSGSLPDEMKIVQEIEPELADIYYADATVLKTMVRSNPGIILFDQGRLIRKWHINDIPSLQTIKEYQSQKLP